VGEKEIDMTKLLLLAMTIFYIIGAVVADDPLITAIRYLTVAVLFVGLGIVTELEKK